MFKSEQITFLRPNKGRRVPLFSKKRRIVWEREAAKRNI